MAYSLDLRIRVVEFVEQGRGVSEAVKVFKVSRPTIYRWLAREDLRPTVVEERQSKLDKEALRKDVEENPDAKLADRAEKLGVKTNTVWYALKKMKITRKKNAEV